MHAYIILFLFMIGSCHGDDKNISPTIKAYKIENATLYQAIKRLNEIIYKEHPDKKSLLVCYVDSPDKKLKEKVKPINLDLKNNPPIATIVQYLAHASKSHYRVYNGRIIVYDWIPALGDHEADKK